MENLQNQNQQNNFSQAPQQNPKKQIPSWLGFVIIFIFIAITFGGVFSYQYFFVKPQLVIQTQVVADQTAGWKTYTNSEYGFEFKYPQNLKIEDGLSKEAFWINLTSLNAMARTIIVAPMNSDDETFKSLRLFSPIPASELSFAKTESIGDVVWNKKEIVDVPRNGIGTYGDQMTYYVEKNNLIYSLTCYGCVPPPDGGADVDNVFTNVLSTFKFTKTTGQTAQPSITVISPNGGEILKIGNTLSIKWSTIGYNSGNDIFVSLVENMGGVTAPCKYLITKLNNEMSNQGIYNWNIPSDYSSDMCGSTKLYGKQFKIAVSFTANTSGTIVPSDESDNYFSIIK